MEQHRGAPWHQVRASRPVHPAPGRLRHDPRALGLLHDLFARNLGIIESELLAYLERYGLGRSGVGRNHHRHEDNAVSAPFHFRLYSLAVEVIFDLFGLLK